MYRMNLVSNKVHNIPAKILFRLSEPLVINIIVNGKNVLLVKHGTGAIVRKAHVIQMKSCMN